MDAATIEKIRALRAEGRSQGEIAQEVSLARSTVSRYLPRANGETKKLQDATSRPVKLQDAALNGAPAGIAGCAIGLLHGAFQSRA